MNDRMAVLAAALIALPIACSHDDRAPNAPPGAPSAGASEVAPGPSPSTTSEPQNVDDPKLNGAPRQSDPSGTAPISDSRTRTLPFLSAQSTGGTSPLGGFGGVGLGGSGGSIITVTRR